MIKTIPTFYYLKILSDSNKSLFLVSDEPKIVETQKLLNNNLKVTEFYMEDEEGENKSTLF